MKLLGRTLLFCLFASTWSITVEELQRGIRNLNRGTQTKDTSTREGLEYYRDNAVNGHTPWDHRRAGEQVYEAEEDWARAVQGDGPAGKTKVGDYGTSQWAQKNPADRLAAADTTSGSSSDGESSQGTWEAEQTAEQQQWTADEWEEWRQQPEALADEWAEWSGEETWIDEEALTNDAVAGAEWSGHDFAAEAEQPALDLDFAAEAGRAGQSQAADRLARLAQLALDQATQSMKRHAIETAIHTVKQLAPHRTAMLRDRVKTSNLSWLQFLPPSLVKTFLITVILTIIPLVGSQIFGSRV